MLKNQMNESAAKPLTSPVSTTTFAKRTCKKCGRERSLVLDDFDAGCIACLMRETGERIAWVQCPKCGKECAKLLEPDACWDCVDAAAKDPQFAAKAAVRRLTEILGSEKAVRDLTLEKFLDVPGTELALKAAKNFNPLKENLYLWGPTGRGKTHLAYAIAQNMARKGLSVEILSMRDFVNRFRLIRPDEEVAQVKQLTRVDVLVIDDLGSVRSSDFSIDILLDVLNKRFLQEKNGLVVTSNLFFDDLARKNNDDRITSRLSGACTAIKVQTGYDYRCERK